MESSPCRCGDCPDWPTPRVRKIVADHDAGRQHADAYHLAHDAALLDDNQLRVEVPASCPVLPGEGDSR